MIKAVIIDLDGTIIDSHPALYKAYSTFLASFGKTGTYEEFISLNLPLQDAVNVLKALYFLPGDSSHLLATYKNLLLSIYADLRPGFEDFLWFAKINQLKLVLVTAADEAWTEKHITKHGLVFDHVFTLCNGTKYNQALEKLNLSPDEVLVVDDNPQPTSLLILPPDFPIVIKTIVSLNYQTLHKGSPLKVIAIPPPGEIELSDALKKKVDEIWEDETSKSPYLFNGKVLHFLHFENSTLTGCFVDYKIFFAKFKNPSLDLKIRSVCLNGITTYDDKLFIAKRSQKVSQYQDVYELLPAGSLDARYNLEGEVDYLQQCLDELHEEANVPPSAIESNKFEKLVFDAREGIYEIVCRLKLNDPTVKLSSEVDEIKLISHPMKKTFVPFSDMLMREFFQ